MQNSKTFLANLSTQPGVYQMLDANGMVLYVGKAKNLKKRVTSYFNKRAQDAKTETLMRHVKDIDITITNTETEAVLLECNLIKKHRPRYNVVLRDDKSYPYIMITINENFPRIDFYRGQRKKNALFFGPYPSAASVRETISLLQKLFGLRTCQNQYFESRTRPCLLYQIGRCTGACAGLISEADYNEHVRLAILFLEGKGQDVLQEMQTRMEEASNKLDFELAAQYRDQVARLRVIQGRQYINVNEGNADIIGFAKEAGVICIQFLSVRHGQILGSRSYFPTVPDFENTETILAAFLTQHYLNHPSHMESIPKQIIVDYELKDRALIERVLAAQTTHQVTIVKPVRGEKKKWLEMATTSAKESLTAHLFSKTNMHDRVLALQKTFSLQSAPKRIECFDISHSQGEATVASCVVFNQEGPIKSDYRRFNITGEKAGDDIAAMHQVLMRRFKRLKQDDAPMPDIILIDGGKAQLNTAYDVMQTLNLPNILLIGVSKGPDRKPGFETIHQLDKPPMHLPDDSLALHFIQQIRDEAHRFAITGHRGRRDKKRRTSTLELIPGIGAKRRRELLRYFGGIQGLARASLDELIKVPGISRPLARRILDALHDANV